MSKVAKIIVDILLVIVCVVGAYFLSNWLFTTIPVSGTSMTETIQDGDNVILYKQGNYRYGDIVVFNTHVQTESGESHYIKRIIALPGDTVEIKNGRLIINEAEVKLYGQPLDEGENMEKTVILQDQYFVIGDNPSSSVDSRSPEFGTVSRSDVMGKVIFTVFSR